MNTETSENTFPTSASNGATGLNGTDGTVRRVAQKAHEAVDKLEQTLGSGSEKVMSLQQEYGQMCREQVRANPLAAVGVAFAVGIVFSKVFMR
jgi:ElaB/YqjD/DUF883 family membrane-anchored ribosome-binding protein